MNKFILAAVMACAFASGCRIEEDKITSIVDDHFSDYPSVELLNHRPLENDYYAVMVTADESYIPGVVDLSTKRMISSIEITDVTQRFSIGSNWGNTIVNRQTGTEFEFSTISGYSNLPGFTHVEISWNCQIRESMELVDGKYFYFVREGHDLRRCNSVWVYGADEKRVPLRSSYQKGWQLEPSHDPDFAALPPTGQLIELIPIFERQDVELVRAAVQAGADVNVTVDNQRVLEKVIARDETELAFDLIEAGAALEDPTIPWTTLEVAMRGDLTFFQSLLEMGADPNAKHLQGNPPIFAAAAERRAEAARILLDAGARIDGENGLDAQGRSILYIPAFLNHAELLTMFLEAGADVSLQPDLIELASQRGDLEVLQTLLDAGAPVNMPQGAERTPLATAIEQENLNTVLWLIDAGADLERADAHGRTPVENACRRGLIDIANALAERLAIVRPCQN